MGERERRITRPDLTGPLLPTRRTADSVVPVDDPDDDGPEKGVEKGVDDRDDRITGGAVTARPGRLRVYLGAAPGVGTTCAMLGEGHEHRRRGADVVVGFVEAHGRRRTEELIDGLETVKHRVVDVGGSPGEVIDLEAVLRRRPQVVLTDDLAGGEGSGGVRHNQRWQDVIVLLDRGIDVFATVSIQHLEGMADAAERIIGKPVNRRVPDWVLHKASQIELVDSSPEELRRRVEEGDVVPAAQVPDALDQTYRTDRLAALRELTLRYLADDTEQRREQYLDEGSSGGGWETHERILVGVTTAPGTETIMRRASRMAARLKADLDVLHVTDPKRPAGYPDDRLITLRQLAADVGGEWSEVRADSPAEALIDFARGRSTTQIVVGSNGRSLRQELLGGRSIIRTVSRLAAAAGVDVHIIARKDPEPDGSVATGSAQRR